HETQVDPAQVFADRLVTLLQALDLPREALDRPRTFVGPDDLVDGGEVARAGHGQTERVDDDLPLAQVGVAEAEARGLDRLLGVGRLRPGHERSLAYKLTASSVTSSLRIRCAPRWSSTQAAKASWGIASLMRASISWKGFPPISLCRRNHWARASV